jgi:hypothetical protein
MNGFGLLYYYCCCYDYKFVNALKSLFTVFWKVMLNDLLGLETFVFPCRYILQVNALFRGPLSLFRNVHSTSELLELVILHHVPESYFITLKISN